MHKVLAPEEAYNSSSVCRKVQFRGNLTYIFDVLTSFPQKKLILASSLVLLRRFDIVHAKSGVH